MTKISLGMLLLTLLSMGCSTSDTKRPASNIPQEVVEQALEYHNDNIGPLRALPTLQETKLISYDVGGAFYSTGWQDVPDLTEIYPVKVTFQLKWNQGQYTEFGIEPTDEIKQWVGDVEILFWKNTFDRWEHKLKP